MHSPLSSRCYAPYSAGETLEGFLERKMYFPEYVPIYSEVENN